MDTQRHEFLRAENYYEGNSVSRGRSDYVCDHCGEEITKGEPSTVHKFYPEFEGWRTHPRCNQPFIDSLIPEEEISRDAEEHRAMSKKEDDGSEIKLNI